MQQLINDVDTLCADWPDWQVVARDVPGMNVTVSRSDDSAHNVIVVTGTAAYPRGPLKFVDTIAEHRFECRDMRFAEALDAALEKWYSDGESLSQLRDGSAVILEASAVDSSSDVIPSVLEKVRETVQALATDIRLRNLARAWFEPGKKHWTVRIGCSLSNLQPFRAKALGVVNSDIIVVEFRWRWNFLHDTDIPSIVDVFSCSPVHLGSTDSSAPLERHLGSLRWYLKSRLESALQKNHVLLERRKFGFTAADDELWQERALFQPQFTAEDFYDGSNTNLFVGLQKFIEARIGMSTARCLICDDILAHQGLKLAVCDKDLCQHSAQTYGLGCDVVHELDRNGMVAELLISLTLAAAQAGKGGRDVLVPMCPVQLSDTAFPGYTGPRDFYKSGNVKDFALLVSLIQQLPSVTSMVAMSGGTDDVLKKQLDSKSPLLFPMLRWILSSNRAHIEPVPERLRIPEMGKYQFHLLSANPTKEGRFQALKAEAKKRPGASPKGSFYVWHGSAPGNWHCILRSGLKNYSNTKFMSAGAAYGPGIYTARSTSISLSYMGQAPEPWSGAQYLSGGGLQLLALCEVVDDQRETSAVTGKPSLRDAAAEIVTIQDEDLIDTRFLFAFAGSVSCSNSLKADSVKISEELRGVTDRS